MLSDEVLDKVIARLTNRIEQGNAYVLEQIGKSIKKIGTLSPSKAQQLAQVLKYGGNYEKITKKLAEITKINVKDIKKIFAEVAKSNYQFAKQFYDYRGKQFIPYDNNMLLKTQVDALANQTANEYVNFSNTLAFTTKVKGKTIISPLAQMYRDAIDTAVLSIAQGKESFNSQMYSTIKNLAASGLKTINYESGKAMRLDSAVRMHLRGALRTLHNEEQKILGSEFDADGVEISVHLNPAPDHALVQGKQFSNIEFDKFQNDIDCYSYDNVFFSKEFKGHDRRSIGELNCYHYIYPVILGISKPLYTNEQLKTIRDNNIKGFMIDGKHYTIYEGTQLQRHLESEIRNQKDLQIIARASGNDLAAGMCQNKIKILTNKYNELSKAAGLPTYMERMRVPDYRRSALASKAYNEYISDIKVGEFDVTKYTNSIKPTTTDVVFTDNLRTANTIKHPNVEPYYDNISNLLANPDKVYMEMTKHNNTIWVINNINGKPLETILKINTATLYQKKTLGYKNSIIHMHFTRDGYINNKVKKGDLKLLFDINNNK